MKRGGWGAVMVVGALLVGGCSSGGASAETSSATVTAAAGDSVGTADRVTDAESDVATVIRVIDGDTFDADLRGTETRIRLLNVDTPETKHPTKAVQCQGPEATRALAELLPVGSTVGLDYDVERTDTYGRTLAGVTGPTGVFVNTELARLGLGVAVVFEPNRKWYDAVRKAQDEAASKRTGLFDPTIDCTIPAAEESLRQAVNASAGTTSAAADEAANNVAAQLARLEAIRTLLRAPPTGFAVASVFRADAFTDLITRAKARKDDVTATASTLRSQENEAAAERERTAAQQRADADARAAAQRATQAAEAERQQRSAADAATAQAAAD